LISLAEVLAAFALMVAPALPWFAVHHVMGVADSELAWLDYGTTYVDVFEFAAMWLIPLGTFLAFGAAVLSVMLPGRGEVAAVAILFAAAAAGGLAQAWDVFVLGRFGDYVQTPGVDYGLVIYLVAALAGVGLAALDLWLGGNSTLVWRALGRPPTKRLGMAIGYAVLLGLALLIGLFPMFPKWFLAGFVALLLAPLLPRIRRGLRASQSGR
jgi:hypothetical protein